MRQLSNLFLTSFVEFFACRVSFVNWWRWTGNGRVPCIRACLDFDFSHLWFGCLLDWFLEVLLHSVFYARFMLNFLLVQFKEWIIKDKMLKFCVVMWLMHILSFQFVVCSGFCLLRKLTSLILWGWLYFTWSSPLFCVLC